MALFGNWQGYPIVGWSFDDQDKLIEALDETSGTNGRRLYDDTIREYKRDYYDKSFNKLLATLL